MIEVCGITKFMEDIIYGARAPFTGSFILPYQEYNFVWIRDINLAEHTVI